MTNIRGNKGCQTYFYEVYVVEDSFNQEGSPTTITYVARDESGECRFWDIKEALDKRDSLNIRNKDKHKRFQCESVQL